VKIIIILLHAIIDIIFTRHSVLLNNVQKPEKEKVTNERIDEKGFIRIILDVYSVTLKPNFD